MYADRGRAAQPSRLQIETLLEFFERNPDFAKGFSKVPSQKEKQRRAWQALSVRLNNLQGCKKNWQQWTKYWADKRNFIRKKNNNCNEKNAAVHGESKVELTDLERRILSLMYSTDQMTLAPGAPVDGHLEVGMDEARGLLDISAPSIVPDQTTVDRLSPSIKRESPQFVDLDNPPSPAYSSSASLPSPGAPSGQSGRQVLRRLPLSQSRSAPKTECLSAKAKAKTASSNRLRQKVLSMSPPTQRLSEFNRIAERFLALEEQRLEVEQQRVEVDRQRVETDQQRVEVDRRNSQTFATLVQRELERDTSTAQALLAIGEGLKLLAEALNK